MLFNYPTQQPRGPVTTSAPKLVGPMPQYTVTPLGAGAAQGGLTALVDALQKATRDKLLKGQLPGTTQASLGLGTAASDAADANSTGSGFVSPIATSALA